MTTSVEITSHEYAERAAAQLRVVNEALKDSARFKATRHGQWCHLSSGNLVEAGYVYGEPWAKILSPDGRTQLDRFRFLGRDEIELERFRVWTA